MPKSILVILSFVFIQISGCGKDNKPSDDPVPDDAVLNIEAHSLASVEASLHLSEVSGALSDNHAAESGSNVIGRSLGVSPLTPVKHGGRHTFDKSAILSCSEQTDPAGSLKVTREVSRRRDSSQKLRGQLVDISESHKKIRTQTHVLRDGTPLKCLNSKLPLIPVSSLGKLKVTSSIEEEHSKSFSFSGEVRRKETLVKKGTRTDDFAIQEGKPSETIRKTSLSMNHSGTRETRKGTLQIGSKMTIDASSPLVIRTIRDPNREKAFDWKQKIFESGTLTSETFTGRRVITSFSNLVFEPGESCAPKSGSVSGEVQEKMADGISFETKHNYTITFSESGAIISFEDGSEETLSETLCVE
jgi:hypothetical protein